MMLITLNACQNKQNVAIVKGYQGDIKIYTGYFRGWRKLDDSH